MYSGYLVILPNFSSTLFLNSQLFSKVLINGVTPLFTFREVARKLQQHFLLPSPCLVSLISRRFGTWYTCFRCWFNFFNFLLVKVLLGCYLWKTLGEPNKTVLANTKTLSNHDEIFLCLILCFHQLLPITPQHNFSF